MDLPRFILGDHSDYPEDIFIIHTLYPRFIINLKDDEVEFLESYCSRRSIRTRRRNS